MGSLQAITEHNVLIESFEVTDLRFPTSLDGVGSDAMHVGTNGSHPYIQLKTNRPDLIGEGIAFSNGRGSELICMALEIFAKRVVGKTMHQLTRDMGKTWRYMVSDSQYRWIGPEKSVTHLAVAGVLNAVWDLWGKILGKPVWKIVCDMSPEEIVRCIDFRYITDVITPEESIEMLRKTHKNKEARLQEALENRAVPAYTTSPGWLAFSGDRMKEVLEETIAAGYTVFKFKVGTSIEADRERLSAVREVLGYDKGHQIMIDANQVWSVPQAIEYMKHLVEFKPVFIEEPTNPDDVLGHAAIRKALRPYGVGVATGEAAQNRVTFKQLLQAEATDVCQIDAVRLGSVNECLAVMLMALKFNVPCVPHNGAMGLTELTSHLSVIDYIAISGQKSMLEFADSHRENLRHPSKIENAYYVTPLEPGYSTGYAEGVLEKYTYPNGTFWSSDVGQKIMASPTGGEL
ncbi:mandelate racemase/muconate lactonizing enzyme family protein [Pochonia chlamydosporia 170]|uniref:Mandelate racemase/muconate lactonizing enzyme family protein n=1 Tax=Pochonia chlamydosporia 170 TaxID=1380566 RepID=A0A179FJP7_METCM|nr:mandelate racemase/muconate lactonizing enzyme family protein [Pochonia chlamydosporia 170]OAQ65243.1 mandelate racemase/muconate lactonizing enzyme family protein [Pochonia chlamydosporia 170]